MTSTRVPGKMDSEKVRESIVIAMETTIKDFG